MRLPAVMLCRAGSKRLPGKNELDWFGTPLWLHAMVQAGRAPCVPAVHVVSDMRDVSAVYNGERGPVRLDVRPTYYWRHPMPDDHTSIQGVNWWRAEAGLEASYCLLIQCTNPFIGSVDIDRLVAIAFHDGPPTEVWAIGSRGRPNGTAWIIPPCAKDTIAKRFVEPDVWGVDIDTLADYEEAMDLWQSLYG